MLQLFYKNGQCSRISNWVIAKVSQLLMVPKLVITKVSESQFKNGWDLGQDSDDRNGRRGRLSHSSDV